MLREWIHSRRWHRAVVETFTSVCPDQWLGRCAASCEETNPVAEVGAQLAAGTFSPQCQWNKTHHYVCSWGHGFDSKPTVWKVLNSQPYNFLSRGILLEGTVSWQVLSLWPSLWCEVTFFFFQNITFCSKCRFLMWLYLCKLSENTTFSLFRTKWEHSMGKRYQRSRNTTQPGQRWKGQRKQCGTVILTVRIFSGAECCVKMLYPISTRIFSYSKLT